MASSDDTNSTYTTPNADAATENESPGIEPAGGGSPFVALSLTSETFHPMAS